MDIPARVKEYLDSEHLSYEVAESAEAAHDSRDVALQPDQIAKLMVLDDGEDKVQALVPADCLLDLNRLCEAEDRSLKALSSQELDTLLKRLGTAALPALPPLTGLRTLVDHRLMDKPQVHLDSGTPGLYLTLAREALLHTLAEAATVDIAVPLAPLEERPDQTDERNDEADIRAAVQQFTGLRIKQRLDETLEIPPMPASAERVIKLRADPYAGIAELAEVVEMDPSLAAQVVSWASSPFYAAPGKIKSVHDAVVRVLGFDLVINLALGLALGRALKVPKDGPRNGMPFWQQAVYCATTTEKLVRAMPKQQRPALGLAYLSGLLHNFGYLVLAFVFPPYFSLVSRYIEANPHVRHDLIERHLLGVTREQMSSWLMSAWHMPPEIVSALRWQNKPDYEGLYQRFPNLLHVALDQLAQHGIGEPASATHSPAVYAQLGLSEDKAAEAVEQVLDKSEHIQDMADALSSS